VSIPLYLIAKINVTFFCFRKTYDGALSTPDVHQKAEEKLTLKTKAMLG